MKYKLVTNKIAYILYLSLAIQAHAIAGGSDRGGGHAHVCFQTIEDRNQVAAIIENNQKQQSETDPLKNIDLNTISVTMLDYQFAVDSIGAQNLIPANGTSEQIVLEQLALLKDKSTFGKIAENLYRTETQPSLWVKSTSGISYINDSADPQTEKPNCLKMQIAFQDQLNIYFDTRLRSKLDTLNDVALVLHETIYRIAKGLGHENSLSVRHLVAKLLSKDFANISSNDMDALFKKMKLITSGSNYFSENVPVLVGKSQQILKVTFQSYTYGFNYSNKSSEYTHYNAHLWNDTRVEGVPLRGLNSNQENGYFEDVLIYSKQLKGLIGGVLSENYIFNNKGSEIELKSETKIRFHEANLTNYFGEKLSRGTLAKDTVINGIACRKETEIFMSIEGQLLGCTVGNDVTYNGIKLRSGTFITFSTTPHYHATKFNISEETEFKIRKGSFFKKTETHQSGSTVCLDDEGYLTECK